MALKAKIPLRRVGPREYAGLFLAYKATIHDEVAKVNFFMKIPNKAGLG